MWGLLARGVTTVGGQRFLDSWVRQLERPSGALGQLVGAALIESNTDLTEAVIDNLRLRDGERVLDVGCGPGQGISAAFDAADVIVHAADPSITMLRRVQVSHRRALRERRLHLHARTLDDLDLVVPLQAAWGVNVVYFLDDPVASLGHLRELLAPGGRVALGYRDRRPEDRDNAFHRRFAELHHAVTTDEVETDLRAAGFTGVLTVDHDADARITIRRRPAERVPTRTRTASSAPPPDLTAL